ncbi:MAG: bifunctional 5,10-methylenetetrahydrofolate dehydrogenase/5,10-methenyltetrahydrofolate cyclohydrolase [Patescibacteria group bacterium]
MVIDGKELARGVRESLKELLSVGGWAKRFLAVVRVGQDPASESFIAQKEKVARELGVDFRMYRFPETIAQDALRDEIGKIAAHKTCGGVIVQLPLPAHIKKEYVLNAIPREKDVDVLGERALGAFYTGRNLIPPPAVGTVLKILGTSPLIRGEAVGGEASLVSTGVASRGSRAASTAGAEERSVLLELEGKRIAIIGAGFLVGKPIATWLMGKVREIHLLDKGSDFGVLENADVVISGAGAPGIVKPEMLKEGAVGIDFGYGTKDSHVMGDFDPACERVCSVFTPTPGGTGPILVAQLFQNFYTLNQKNDRVKI